MTKAERIYMETRIDVKKVIETEGVNELGLVKLKDTSNTLTISVTNEVRKLNEKRKQRARVDLRFGLITEEQHELEMDIAFMVEATCQNTYTYINKRNC